MSVTAAMSDDLMRRSQEVVHTLACNPVLEAHVDSETPLPRPFHRCNDVRLVIIGQDPTVEDEKSRREVTTVLMLDIENGLLPQFISRLCTDLGICLDNVYATNLCKNFFRKTPTRIKSEAKIDVIGISSPVWLPLLQEELSWFPNAAVITLGEPVLQCLVRPGFPQQVRGYWGYQEHWLQDGFGEFRSVLPEQTVIGRRFFPFVHLNTNRKSRSGKFYEARWKDYIGFVRDQIRQEGKAWAS